MAQQKTPSNPIPSLSSPGFPEARLLKRKSDMHWLRKAWHTLGVLVMLGFYTFTPPTVWLSLLLALWCLEVPADFLRLRSPRFNEWAIRKAGILMRENERHHLAAMTSLLSGVLLVAVIFPRPVMVLTLLVLAFADPIASFVGIRYGTVKILGSKSLQGSLAAFTVCFLVSYVYVGEFLHLDLPLFWFATIAALAGTLAELIPIGKIDDNFTLPLVSAATFWLLFLIFGMSIHPSVSGSANLGSDLSFALFPLF